MFKAQLNFDHTPPFAHDCLVELDIYKGLDFNFQFNIWGLLQVGWVICDDGLRFTPHSNAWALEVATKRYPHTGSLITFAQFLIVSIVGLPKQLCIRLRVQSHVRRPPEPSKFEIPLKIPSELGG